MEKTSLLLFGIMLLLAACDKDDPVPLPQGAFTATSITEDLPVRAFVKDGKITNTTTISQLLIDYDNYILASWEVPSFTEVELDDDVIRIYPSYIESTLGNETVKYNYMMDRQMLLLEMQDTIEADPGFSDYFIQLFNGLNVYPLPEFKEEYRTTAGGFHVISKYKDKRYIEIIDENTIRRHFARYLYVVNYTMPDYQTFWTLPIELNNYFNETGYPVINEDDTVLVKEFEIEYRKTGQ